MKKNTLLCSIAFSSFYLFGKGTIDIDGFNPICNVGKSPTNCPGDKNTQPKDIKRYFQIYLPEAYFIEQERSFPVIYFLHAFGHNHTSYFDMLKAVDQLITKKEIAPVIIVKPDASTNNEYLGSFYTNSKKHGDFETYIVHELRYFINNKYRTKKSPTNTFLIGHGMGAYGALLYAIKYPEIYRTIYCIDPDPLIAISSCYINPQTYTAVLSEIPNSGIACKKILPCNGPATYILHAQSAALSTSSVGTMFDAALPLSISNNQVPQLKEGQVQINNYILKQWLTYDPLTLLQQNKECLLNSMFYFENTYNSSLCSQKATKIILQEMASHQFNCQQLGSHHNQVIDSEDTYSPSRFSIPYELINPLVKKIKIFLRIKKTKWNGALPFPYHVNLIFKTLGIDPKKYFEHNAAIIKDMQIYNIPFNDLLDDVPQAAAKLPIDPILFDIPSDKIDTKKAFFNLCKGIM